MRRIFMKPKLRHCTRRAGSCIVRGMRLPHTAFTLRASLFAIVAGSLALASCVSADDEDDSQTVDVLDGTPQLPHKNVCGGGQFVCKSHVRVDEHNRITPFATPSGLGPADLVDAYKLNASISSTATIAI